jgi:hypothetical protein
MNRTALALALLPLVLPVTARAIDGTGFDSITTPGHPVKVHAKFERKLFGIFNPDVKHEPATVEVLGATTHVRTDGEGEASAMVTPTAPGVYPIVASLDRHHGVRAESKLWVLDPSRPVYACDIDGTLSDMPDYLVPFAGGKAKTFAGAPELIRELSSHYQIIYLTARDDHFDGKTRTFLARHGFPAGPIIYNDLGLENSQELSQLNSANHGKFKLAQLQALASRGVQVAFGIGNAETDAYAYEQDGIKSYILTKVHNPGPSFRFTAYAQLRPQLVTDGFLPASTGLASAVAGAGATSAP